MNFPKIYFFILGLFGVLSLQAQEIEMDWQPREDLNINLPKSVQVFDAWGKLPDGKPIRAMYAEIDLRDENLKLRSIGSNSIRETTKETYEKSQGILAINGGYFAATSSVSLIVEDGETIAPGPSEEFTRGAFGMHRGRPQIVWANSGIEEGVPYKFEFPDVNSASEKWEVSQAVGGGPVLVKNGKLRVSSKEEAFGGSHLIRHPRTAIGYKDKNTLLMMLVDGRQDASAGVTLPELGRLMLQIGAKEALNLDGGGSSAMVAANEVVNIPADITGGNRNSLRKNAGALVLSQIQPDSEKKVIIFDTDSENYAETGIWKSSNQVNFYGESPARTASSNPINKAVYSFEGIERKQYQLGIWFPVHPEENAAKVNYILHKNGKSDTIALNQQDFSNLGKWNVPGNFEIGPEDKLEIMSTAEGKFLVDAIRLVETREQPVLPKRGDVRIAVISDLNSGLGAADYEWQVDSIINRLPRFWQPDLVICGGDMVAGMGISDEERLSKMWAGFNEHIAAPLKNDGIPFAFTLGNHDGPRSYPVEHDFARKFWRENQNKPGLEFVDDSQFPNYYSFMQNEIFIVSWEASSPVITDENLKWLEEQFSTPAAKNAKYRFVMGHMPLYSVAQERDSKGNVLENPEKLQALLEKYRVHTYISGHQHAYYPGRRGKLELLNTGAAGSGARSWLDIDKAPVNSITIMDIFKESDSIVYSTYDIKKEKASEMPLLDQTRLPTAMFGVNGYMLRRDINSAEKFSGFFSGLNSSENKSKGLGHLRASIDNQELMLEIDYFNFPGQPERLVLYRGRNGESGPEITKISIQKKDLKNSKFRTKLRLSEELRDLLAAGAVYARLEGPNNVLRTQIYSEGNKPPKTPEITSHKSQNTYGVRNIEALMEFEWTKAEDPEGDFVTYVYQVAKDAAFRELIFTQKTGRKQNLKMTEAEWYSKMPESEIGEKQAFFHRVLASDGKHFSASEVKRLQLVKSDEVLDDLVEVPAPTYKFSGKIAEGAGYGAEWDKEGKIWLADYNRGLIIKTPEGTDAGFSPLTSVEIDGEIYKLNPVNGIGVDNDGNILAGINRRLIKIDANTGKGIAVWEAPDGARAITAPRASKNGEIYAMSLFAEDPNYVLQQNGSAFELLRQLKLEGRNLSRTFDMSPDGKKLYFPDPGSPRIQVYSSEDGVNYTKEKDISSINAGSSAIQLVGNSLYAAVRSSGVSPSSFHFRDEIAKQMWTLELPEVNGAEPRGIGVSPNGDSLIFCSWDQDGGYYMFKKEDK